MTKAGHLTGSKLGTIKYLSQRIALHGRQLPMGRQLAGRGIAGA